MNEVSTYGRAASVVAATVVAGALLTGCSDDSTGSGDTADQAASSATPAAPSGNRYQVAEPADVPEILDFEATQVSGDDFDARKLAGQNIVFWFWAPWCAECSAAAAEVQAAAEASPDVRFVGVAGLSSDVGAMQTFVDQHGLTFPQLADGDGGVYTRFGIAQQDTYVLVSADGDAETVSSYSTDADPRQLIDDAFG